MQCMYLSKTLNGKIRCRKYKRHISLLLACQNCSDFILKANKPIKKKTNRQQKLEKKRFSILTNDFNRCYYCKKESEKLDIHEVYGGSNRTRSIKNGLVVPLCRFCHRNEKIINKLRIQVQKEFEKTHSREEFIKITNKSYIKGDD